MQSRAGLGQRLVIPDAVLPVAFADAVVGFSGSVGVGEGAPVERHAEDEFGSGDAADAGVVVYRGVGVEGCAARVGGVVIEV